MGCASVQKRGVSDINNNWYLTGTGCIHIKPYKEGLKGPLKVLASAVGRGIQGRKNVSKGPRVGNPQTNTGEKSLQQVCRNEVEHGKVRAPGSCLQIPVARSELCCRKIDEPGDGGALG